MIRHTVLLRFNDSVTDGGLDAMAAALDALPAQIPELLTYEHGRDLGLAPTNFDYAISATFARADDFPAYRDHPAHQQFIADFITDQVADRVAVQFELTD